MRTFILAILCGGILCAPAWAWDMPPKAAQAHDAKTLAKLDPKLTDVALQWFPGSMAALHKRVPAIERLTLEDHGRIDLKDLQHIAKFEKLRHLSLQGDMGFAATHFAVIGKLTELRTLHLSLPWVSCNAAGLAALSHLTNLESLTILSLNYHEKIGGSAVLVESDEKRIRTRLLEMIAARKAGKPLPDRWLMLDEKRVKDVRERRAKQLDKASANAEKRAAALAKEAAALRAKAEAYRKEAAAIRAAK